MLKITAQIEDDGVATTTEMHGSGTDIAAEACAVVDGILTALKKNDENLYRLTVLGLLKVIEIKTSESDEEQGIEAQGIIVDADKYFKKGMVN